jgi:hypothetical protein
MTNLLFFQFFQISFHGNKITEKKNSNNFNHYRDTFLSNAIVLKLMMRIDILKSIAILLKHSVQENKNLKINANSFRLLLKTLFR